MTGRTRFRNHETRVKLVGCTIQINFEGKKVDAWREKLGNYRTKADNLEPFFDEFGEYMLGSIKRNFQAQGRPDSWKPLAESTIQQRIRQGYGAEPILQRTKKMMKGFHTDSDKTFLRILNNVPHYKYHQQDKGRGRKIPRRIMVLLQVQDRAYFTKLLRKHLGE